MCLNTFFFSKLKENENVALQWLEINLKGKDILTHCGHILIEELLIPINMNNQHWILVTIDMNRHCYYANNPYKS